MLAKYQNTPDSWATSSDGQEGVFPSPSGMVGETNSIGAWFIYIPPPGIVYKAHYWGRDVELLNLGDGTYNLRLDGGEVTRHLYASRWEDARFFDSAGRALSDPAAAEWIGDPQPIYSQPGARMQSLRNEATITPIPIPTSPSATVPGTVVPPPVASPITGTQVPIGTAEFPTVNEGASPGWIKWALAAAAAFTFLK